MSNEDWGIPEFSLGADLPDVTKEDDLDKEIKAFFKEDDPLNESLYEIGRDRAMREQALKSVKKDISEGLEKRAQIDREIADIQAAMRKRIEELRESRDAIDKHIFDWRREARELQREIDEIKRRMELELEKLKAGLAFKSRWQEYDVNTSSLAWRQGINGKQILEFQYDDAAILANAARGICGNKMGLGKNLTAIAWADMLKSRRLLYICPSDLAENVENEFKFWAPHRPVISLYKMSKIDRRAMIQIFRMMDEITVVINFESWRKDNSLIQDLIDLGFDSVVVDEAHNIKETDSNAFRGVEKIVLAENACPKCRSVQVQEVETEKNHFTTNCRDCGWDVRDFQFEVAERRSVKNVLPMTGTPFLNRPQEIYPLLRLILPEIFYEKRHFLDLYCEQDMYTGYWKWKNGGLDRLMHHLHGRFTMRTKKDEAVIDSFAKAGIEMFEQVLVEHEIVMDPVAYPLQWKIMQQLTKHAQIMLESGKRMSTIATIALITRKRQANVWPGGISVKDEDGNIIWSVGEEVQESIKVDWAVNKYEEWVSAGYRCVGFSQFKPPLHEIARRLNERGIRAVVFDGDTPQHLRSEIKLDVDAKYVDPNNYKYDVVLCNYRTGGVGLNFTSMSKTLIIDEEWNPGKNDQAYGRTDRIGQTQETEVHILRLGGTIDTWMKRLNDHKAGVVGGFEAAAMDSLQDMLLEGLRNGEV